MAVPWVILHWHRVSNLFYGMGERLVKFLHSPKTTLPVSYVSLV